MIQETVPSIGEALDNKSKIYQEKNFKDFKLNQYNLEANDQVSFENPNYAILFVLKGLVSTEASDGSKYEANKAYATYFIERNVKVVLHATEDSIVYVASY